MVRPTIAGSLPNARDQRPLVNTATLAPERSSSSVIARPRAGLTPRTVNRFGDTRAATRRSGSLIPDSS